MLNCLVTGLGGFIGAVLRYLIGMVPLKETMVFPLKTFIINIAGCIAIGYIVILAAKNVSLNPRFVLFFKTGLCGGFTTFSTFALETTDLIRQNHTGIAFLYALFSIVAGVSVIFLLDILLNPGQR